MKNIVLERIVKPKTAFNESDKAKLGAEALMVAREAFGTNMTKEDVDNHFYELPDLVYLARLNKKLISFCSFRNLRSKKKNILYLDGIVVVPKHQKQGLFRKITDTELEYGSYDYFVTRTQSAVVYGATKGLRTISEIYPNKDKPVPKEIKKVAKDISDNELKMKRFSLKTLVDRETYGVALHYPTPYYPGVSEFFNQDLKIEYDKGDSILIIAQVA